MSNGIAAAADAGRQFGLQLLYNEQRNRTSQYISDLEAKLDNAWDQIRSLRENLRYATERADRNGEAVEKNADIARSFHADLVETIGRLEERDAIIRARNKLIEQLTVQVKDRDASIFARDNVIEQQKAQIAVLSRDLEQSYEEHESTGHQLSHTTMHLEHVEKMLLRATPTLKSAGFNFPREEYQETGFLVKARNRGLDLFTDRKRNYARGNEITSFMARFMRFMLRPETCCLDSLIRAGSKISSRSSKPTYNARAWARYSAYKAQEPIFQQDYRTRITLWPRRPY